MKYILLIVSLILSVSSFASERYTCKNDAYINIDDNKNTMTIAFKRGDKKIEGGYTLVTSERNEDEKQYFMYADEKYELRVKKDKARLYAGTIQLSCEEGF